MRILLKKGRIYDGTGADAFVGDILVEDERIVTVGDDLREEADQVIDLTGLSVSSGFFDAHSHNDWFAIKKEPLKYLEPFIRQGITSFITGNCGLSAVGFEPDSPYVDKVGGGLFGYCGIVFHDQYLIHIHFVGEVLVHVGVALGGFAVAPGHLGEFVLEDAVGPEHEGNAEDENHDPDGDDRLGVFHDGIC